MSLDLLPAKLKPIGHYIKTAIEHDKRDPVVAYYCRFYAVKKGIEIDSSSPECKSYLLGLMDYLEKQKQAAPEDSPIKNEVVGQAHVENYALKVFLYADNEDRAGRHNKNVVKSFYTAGMLFDVLSVFDEVSEDIEKNKKYAKWKAAYIHKCLRNGETPIAGPLPENDEEDIPQPSTFSDATAGPSSYSSQPPDQPSPPYPSGNQPHPGTQSAPGGAQGWPQAPSQATHQSPPQPHHSAPVPQDTWKPPSNPSGVKLKSEDYQKAQKFCKFASSALQYEDPATAIDNLTKALKLLTTGKES
ncbi:vacuolar protein sorting-associated protein VTA1 homolog [Saccostrea echinata]|uniref:vacuolar protein sorting-associated protein VTA1 homolog n=1 Tax=Saccostrea echinata TaxID=191078 RepID=UPI002A7EE97D|nr:vacuolar protein sorting-associated protein VTA1 homolog [Saccostrea echinata]